MIEVPVLDHDALMLEFGHKVSPMGRLERRIVFAQLSDVEAAGFKVESVFDGEEHTKVQSAKEAMELIFNLDDSFVFVSGGHWIRFVLGNGIDCVCDYSYSVGDTDGFNTLMETFAAEEYA